MTHRLATIYSEALPTGETTSECQLVVIEGTDKGRAARLGDRPLSVGTAASCDLVLRDDRVSACHATIGPAGGGRFVVTDTDSANGIVYEGSLISEATVPIGATLKLGRTFVRIQPIARPLQVEPSQARSFGDLVGESLAIREVFAVLELAARSDVTVLLEGETGTGKELAARAIHEASDRRKGPFVAIDCGALPESLLESELLGHVRGAFTGATSQRGGAFVRAHTGTIFLDELGSVPAPVQARLLRVLEERRVRAVGADSDRPVDIRVVAASREPLDPQVAEGGFRADLFYRLSVVRVKLPPLRARREDIAPIAAELLRRRGIDPGPIAGPGFDRLHSHAWPGNVRELRNVVDRAVALAPGARSFAELAIAIDGHTVADDPLAVRTDLPFGEAKQAIVHAFERRYLGDLFSRCESNISATARETGIDRKHLRALLRKHGLIE